MNRHTKKSERVVLEVLSHGQKLSGLEIINGSNGRLRRARIYWTLKRLVDDGLVDRIDSNEVSDDGLKRRFFRISGLGQRVLQDLRSDYIVGLGVPNAGA